MASLCTRCALRLQKSSRAGALATTARSFSASPSQNREQIPTFVPSSNTELDDALAAMRTHYFIPAYLPKRERTLIYRPKYKQYLQDFPQSYKIGKEDVLLQWTDRLTEVPNRKMLLNKILNLMREGEREDWQNLPALLEGLNQCFDGKMPTAKLDRGRIVRLAMLSGNMNVILTCLSRASATGMSFENEGVLGELLWGLRSTAQNDAWSKQATQQALKDAKKIAILSESQPHRRAIAGRNGARRADLLGAFLELAAVHAYLHQDQKDVDGLVQIYTERLLESLGASLQVNTTPAEHGPQTEMQRWLPILQGLSLAQKVLGADFKDASVVSNMVAKCEEGLSTLVSNLEARLPEEREYDRAALNAWNERIKE